MRPLILALGGLLLASNAFAARHEVNFDLGLVTTNDETYDLFGDNNNLFGLGVTAGVVVWDLGDLIGVHIMGGWNRTWQGADVVVLNEDFTESGFQTSLFTDEFNLGPKVSLTLWDFLTPYLTVQGAVVHAAMRLDGDVIRDENADVFKRTAVTGGVRSMVGLEFLIPHDRSPVALGIYSEAGYGWYGKLHWQDFGDMQTRGFAFRSGVGLRF